MNVMDLCRQVPASDGYLRLDIRECGYSLQVTHVDVGLSFSTLETHEYGCG